MGENKVSLAKSKSWLLLGLALVLLVSCSNTPPIDTSNPVAFNHSTKVFALLVPGSWKQAQDQVETEALAAFSDPTGRAEIVAYAGLLDRRLSDEEGTTIVTGLIKTLLNSPADLQIGQVQRRADGAFVAPVNFTRNQQKRAGQAVFRDTDLALSGVIISGPTENWTDLQKALQLFADSFRVDRTTIEGSYFVPLDGKTYALAVPADWQRTSGTSNIRLKSRTGDMAIYTTERPISPTLTTPELVAQATLALRQSFALNASASSSEQLPDGRTKITFDRSQHRVIGYVEQKGSNFTGLFFDVPADRADAYQPFIDFVYSTFVTGLQ